MYFVVLAHLHCPSGASLHYVVCRTTCILLQLSFGQLLVSFAPLHSLHPTFRYHFATFVAIHLLRFMASHLLHTKANAREATFHFAKPTLQYSLGFIIASLRPAFISIAFSPPAANNFACLACLPRLRVCHGFCSTAQGPKIKNTRRTLA